MMREDMEAMGAVRLSDVDESQAAMVATAMAPADAGEIVVSGGGEEEFIHGNRPWPGADQVIIVGNPWYFSKGVNNAAPPMR